MKNILEVIFSNNEIVIDFNSMHDKEDPNYKSLLFRVFNSYLKDMIEKI